MVTNGRRPDDGPHSARESPGVSESELPPLSCAQERDLSANGAKEDGLGPIVMRFGEEIADAAKRLMEVYADRMRIGVRRSILQIVLGAAAGVCAIVWLSASSLATLRGLCGEIGRAHV